MGLDVNLHRYTGNSKLETEFESLKASEYYEYDIPSEAVELDSEIDPEHMFKVGYIRSSYNSSGINSVLRNKIGMDLYDVFPHNQDDYMFTPDWELARTKIKQIMRLLKKSPPYLVMEVSKNPFSKETGPTSCYEALKLAADQLGRNSFEGGYSSKDGEFYPQGREIVAFVPGVTKGFAGDRECVYAVYKEDPKNIKWYMDALKIVLEMIEYVEAQADSENYFFHWSA